MALVFIRGSDAGESHMKCTCDTEALRQKLDQEFPAYKYFGQVMTNRPSPSDPEFVSGDDLDAYFAGKTWKEFDAEYLANNPSDFVLLTAEAVCAFLAAWLWEASDCLDDYNEGRDALISMIALSGGSYWKEGFRLLTKRQRETIYRILECGADSIDEYQKQRGELDVALLSIRVNLASAPR